MRSLFAQAAWNSERMQNLGFSYGLIPLLENKSEDELKETLVRHLEFFNTHPYMSGGLIAAVAGMENGGEKEERIRAFKQSMMGPFGALGDSFFWCSLKPFVLLIGVMFALSGHLVLTILVPLAIYSLVHFWFRFWIYKSGIEDETKMITSVSRLRFAFYNKLLGIGAAIIIAVLSLFALGSDYIFSEIPSSSIFTGVLTVTVVLITAIAIKRGLKPSTLIYLAAGFGLLTTLAIF